MIAALVSGDAERFYREETEQRRSGGLPPFGRLAAIIVSAEDKGAAEAHARALARTAHAHARGQGLASRAARRRSRRPTRSSLLGPAEAPIAVLRKRHRFRLAAKAPRSADLQGFLRALLAAAPPPRGGVQGGDRRRSAELFVRLAAARALRDAALRADHPLGVPGPANTQFIP